MKNIFFVMDGALAAPAGVEGDTRFPRGFFAKRPPLPGMLAAARLLVGQHGCRVFVLSALCCSIAPRREKEAWLDKYLPEVPRKNQLFAPCAPNELARFCRPPRPGDILADSDTANLQEWERRGGTGVKVLNGENGRVGSWQKPAVNAAWDGTEIAARILLGENPQTYYFCPGDFPAMDLSLLEKSLRLADIPYLLTSHSPGGTALSYSAGHEDAVGRLVDLADRRCRTRLAVCPDRIFPEKTAALTPGQ